MGKTIGIDLGTTYSCMAFVNADKDGLVEVIKNKEGMTTTPSVVYFGEDGSIVAGAVAKSSIAMEPERCIERIKTKMGTDYRFFLDDKEHSPEFISACILKKMKADAEEFFGEEVTDAVITVPAYFGFKEKTATETAGKIAGLNVLQVINEPTAAAVDYALSLNGVEDGKRTVLVYDLGGGTFDITLMELQFVGGEVTSLQVLTSDGNHQLGGKNWDDKLAELCTERFCEQNPDLSADELVESEDMNEFNTKIEDIKKMLSDRDSYPVKMHIEGQKARFDVTVDDFNQATEDLLGETIDLTNSVLQRKNLTPADINEIILVGGSTRMRQVKQRLTDEYNIHLVQYNPDEAVARGAAFVANSRVRIPDAEEMVKCNGCGYEGLWATYVTDAQGNICCPQCGGVVKKSDTPQPDPDPTVQVPQPEPVVIGFGIPGGAGGTIDPIDVTNKTYGIEVVGDKISNVLIKDTPLPADMTGNFSTSCTNQKSLVISVHETECYDKTIVGVDNGNKIAEFVVEITEDLPKGAPINVTFKLDNGGILTLLVENVTTGQIYPFEIRIEGCVSKEEIEELTDKLAAVEF